MNEGTEVMSGRSLPDERSLPGSGSERSGAAAGSHASTHFHFVPGLPVSSLVTVAVVVTSL